MVHVSMESSDLLPSSCTADPLPLFLSVLHLAGVSVLAAYTHVNSLEGPREFIAGNVQFVLLELDAHLEKLCRNRTSYPVGKLVTEPFAVRRREKQMGAGRSPIDIEAALSEILQMGGFGETPAQTGYQFLEYEDSTATTTDEAFHTTIDKYSTDAYDYEQLTVLPLEASSVDEYDTLLALSGLQYATPAARTKPKPPNKSHTKKKNPWFPATDKGPGSKPGKPSSTKTEDYTVPEFESEYADSVYLNPTTSPPVEAFDEISTDETTTTDPASWWNGLPSMLQKPPPMSSLDNFADLDDQGMPGSQANDDTLEEDDVLLTSRLNTTLQRWMELVHGVAAVSTDLLTVFMRANGRRGNCLPLQLCLSNSRWRQKESFQAAWAPCLSLVLVWWRGSDGELVRGLASAWRGEGCGHLLTPRCLDIPQVPLLKRRTEAIEGDREEILPAKDITLASHLMRTLPPATEESTPRPEVPFFNLFNRIPYLHEGLHWSRPTSLEIAGRHGAVSDDDEEESGTEEQDGDPTQRPELEEAGQKGYWQWEHPVRPSDVAVFSHEDAVTGPLAHMLLQASLGTLRDRAFDTKKRRVLEEDDVEN